LALRTGLWYDSNEYLKQIKNHELIGSVLCYAILIVFGNHTLIIPQCPLRKWEKILFSLLVYESYGGFFEDSSSIRAYIIVDERETYNLIAS